MPSAEKITALIRNPLWNLVTDIQNWSTEELLELLAEDTEPDKWRYVSAHKMVFPHPIPNSIADVPPSRPQSTSNQSTTRAPHADVFPSNELGNLGRLPLEVVWRIIDNMDIEVFLKFAATSRLARSLCKQHPAFKNIATYLPSLLVVLRSLELHQWVPVGALWDEIQQPKCRSCGEKAHLLFVPTIDRICVNCLMYNPAYWYMQFIDAKIAFALEHENLERVPAFRDIVVRYANQPPMIPRPRIYLFPIKPTLKLAIQLYGTRENLKLIAECHAIDRFEDSTAEEQLSGFLHRFWRDAPLGKLPCDPTQAPKMDYDLAKAHTLGDIDIRRAATWIPFLLPTAKSPVKLYRCKGCFFIFDHFKITLEHRRYMGDAHLDVTPSDYRRILKGRCRIVHTWEDMLEHIPKCLGSGLRMWRRSILSRHPEDLSSDF